ncbi:hypothetical protein JHN55_11925 [Streptomyces sp. MBT56]|uniref:hypothetical protein n=1 Tax=unclassified Streptomyces TaxID=2593676 RepID=UPI00190B25FF|nr:MULTISPECIES: hypothetical protein [unclassified Streptomyces]MBK3557225.1 hypothetical protein [Streptomyces sp. MBT56]MBK3601853.1 hypothetical protein [Streptomyces sp. MBT54]MBK3618181.1 hypothetical protein [Streptomyces sp. MBT98]MBK3625826.1 hypothetical protein [Streptomyces sp. MBT49]
MSTQKMHTVAAGPIELDLSVSNGRINVHVNPAAAHATVTVHTAAEDGPIADAVNDTKFTEHGNKLTVSVPDDMAGGIGGTNVVQVGGSTFSFGGGVVNTGTMTGVTISDGDIWIGGQHVVANGQVVAQQGAKVGGATGTITVDVVLPAGSSPAVSTKNAETTVRGDLETIRFDARNGSLQAGGVKVLEAETHNGSVLVDRVEEELEASTHNGSITLGAYNGRRGSARTHNGDVTISATPAASGKLAARTHNGNIRVRGAGHLDLKTSTHNGRVW